ncbi:hypothetical protein B0H11DRAFT_1856839 [Mycena galericulata]|nr:hypothetical protein B0H11DRAFT_1856839 [Mycena galericulata]
MRFQMLKPRVKGVLRPPLRIRMRMKMKMAQLPRMWTARFMKWKRKAKAVLQLPMRMKIATSLLLRKCASLHLVTDVELSWSWKAIMFVKLGLILALGLSSLCEYGWAVLSQ